MQEPQAPPPIHADARPVPRARRASSRLEYALSLVIVLALMGIAWYSGGGWRSSPPTPVAAAGSGPAAPSRATTPAAAAPASVPSVRYPVEAAASAPALPPLDDSDLEMARRLEDLLGRGASAQLRTSGLVRHIVATVDNLARGHAPAAMWPVNPSPGRFEVLEADGRSSISPDNELRYTPLVLLAESVDMARLAALYRASYPLFQQAYEELGFPGKPFNDRLVDVIDHLLAAPEPPGPLLVERVRVEGPTPLVRPWVHYTFADPRLESLSAGQKILVRVGLSNERRLKAQLARLRAALVPASPR